MNITTYIRKEDEHLWKAIPNKAEWLHAALNKLDYRVPPAPNEPVYEQVPPAKLKTKNIVSADAEDSNPEVKMKVMDNDALKALLGTKAKPIKDEPRHVCPPACKHWVWDIDRGGRVNTYTGEFEEGEPW